MEPRLEELKEEAWREAGRAHWLGDVGPTLRVQIGEVGFSDDSGW